MKSGSPISRAIAIAGSQSALARRVGCTPQLISACERGTRRVSGDLAIKISRETGIALRDLRPDLFVPGDNAPEAAA